MPMTPKEALEHISSCGRFVEIHEEHEGCPKCAEALAVLRALVEGPIISGDDYQKLLLSLANILCKLQPTWVFTGEPFVALNAIERALELQPTVQEVREEIERRKRDNEERTDHINGLTACGWLKYGHAEKWVLLKQLLDFIDRKGA